MTHIFIRPSICGYNAWAGGDERCIYLSAISHALQRRDLHRLAHEIFVYFICACGLLVANLLSFDALYVHFFILVLVINVIAGLTRGFLVIILRALNILACHFLLFQLMQRCFILHLLQLLYVFEDLFLFDRKLFGKISKRCSRLLYIYSIVFDVLNLLSFWGFMDYCTLSLFNIIICILMRCRSLSALVILQLINIDLLLVLVFYLTHWCYHAIKLSLGDLPILWSLCHLSKVLHFYVTVRVKV